MGGRTRFSLRGSGDTVKSRPMSTLRADHVTLRCGAAFLSRRLSGVTKSFPSSLSSNAGVSIMLFLVWQCFPYALSHDNIIILWAGCSSFNRVNYFSPNLAADCGMWSYTDHVEKRIFLIRCQSRTIPTQHQRMISMGTAYRWTNTSKLWCHSTGSLSSPVRLRGELARRMKWKTMASTTLNGRAYFLSRRIRMNREFGPGRVSPSWVTQREPHRYNPSKPGGGELQLSVGLGRTPLTGRTRLSPPPSTSRKPSS